MKAGVVALGILLMATYAEAAPKLRCETGPINRVIGGTDWLVYSCDDRRSMVVVSTEKNPAAPFYFFLTPQVDGYRIDGEGTGSNRASDAAGNELSRMTQTEFAKLLAATTAAPDRK